LDEIKEFNRRKEVQDFDKLNDHAWITSLMFFIDLSVHLNDFNLKLQGFGKSIDVMFGYIKAFEVKIKIFTND
jgi:hypothetical protein